MEDKIMAVRAFLIGKARRRSLTSYTDAGAVVGLDMASDVGRILIAQILDAINTDEVSQGHPMISALVIYQDLDRMRPGAGFFACARGLGKLTDNDEDGFWAMEVSAIFTWWASH